MMKVNKCTVLSLDYMYQKIIRKVYSNYSSLLSSENSLYEEKIDLEILQTQGYSANSVKYRIAQLEFGDVQRDVEQKKRDLEQSIVEFSSKCGLQNPLQLSLLANVEFAFVDEDFASLYPMQKFDDVEQAEWDLNMLQSQILAEKAFNIYMDANYILNDLQEIELHKLYSPNLTLSKEDIQKNEENQTFRRTSIVKSMIAY